MSIRLASAAILLAVGAAAMTIAFAPSGRLQNIAFSVSDYTGMPLLEIGPTRADIQAAQEHVAAKSPEPEKAKFRSVRVNGLYLCGEVNLKNQYGGYTGYRWFYTTWDPQFRDRVMMQPDPASGYNFDPFYDSACGVAK